MSEAFVDGSWFCGGNASSHTLTADRFEHDGLVKELERML